MDVDRVIYHGGCPDGIAAAWPFWRENKHRNVIFEGYKHGQPPPTNVYNENIVIVDFCFPKKDLLEMAKKAKSILILDHHISTERNIGMEPIAPNIKVIYDKNKSGAQIVWEYVYPRAVEPWFIKIIAQRDLWNWTDKRAKEIGEGLFINGYYKWNKLEELYGYRKDKKKLELFQNDMYYQGSINIREKDREISIICSNSILAAFKTPQNEVYKVRVVSCPYKYRSDVGNSLCEKYPSIDFAVTWMYDFLLDEWWVSCRGSKKSKLDLSKICSQFDRSGGHEKACGFTIFGSKSENLHTYFKPIEIPSNRSYDTTLVEL